MFGSRHNEKIHGNEKIRGNSAVPEDGNALSIVCSNGVAPSSSHPTTQGGAQSWGAQSCRCCAPKAALREAEAGALSDYVIEWAGKRVKSLNRGIKTAGLEAGISKTVSPHILRHSAAVHMAEDRRSMEEIQQFLGHSDINVTRKIYARLSPSYLKEAAAALEFDDLGSTNQRTLPNADDQPLISFDELVGATGIEPVTPTMSTPPRSFRHAIHLRATAQ